MHHVPHRAANAQEEQRQMTRTVELRVTGEQPIHCASCEQRIQRALRQVKGVQDVRASVAGQQVVATIDAGEVDPDRLREKLRDLGYEAVPAGDAG
jgi:copper chaperone CopZ